MGQALILTYFFYGLSFFAMGLAMLLETGRSPALAEGRALRFLAAFGLLHGTHEWMESYLLQAQAAGSQPAAFYTWLRLLLLVSSFIALFTYAYLALSYTSPLYHEHKLLHFDRLAIYMVIVAGTVAMTYEERPVQWVTLIDVLARYLLAAPAGALAGLALVLRARAFRAEGRTALIKPVMLAGISFFVYAAAQFVVRSIPAFPALYVNQETMLQSTGIPIQAVRTLAAILITIGLIRATQVLEQERQALLSAAHRARMEALEERDALRRDLLHHVVRSQEEERGRISRELHDEIAQMLSAFSLELAALRSSLKRVESQRKVDHLLLLSRQMSQSLYRLVRDLRPANLDDLGLVPALNSLVAQDCKEHGLTVDFIVCGSPQRLNPLMETVLFRVAQEAINNVCRHARVKHVRVELEYMTGQVALRVVDKGAGFNPQQQFRPPRGWGLAGMRERVESVAGHLRLDAEPGRGTTIEATIPLGEEKETVHGQDQIAAGG